jgi:hypothetical protein
VRTPAWLTRDQPIPVLDAQQLADLANRLGPLDLTDDDQAHDGTYTITAHSDIVTDSDADGS